MTVERGTDAGSGAQEIEALRADLRRIERDYEVRLRELANLTVPPPSPEASLGPYHLMLDLERARSDLEAQLERSEDERHRVTAERDGLAAERDGVAAERDTLAAERDRLAAERDAAVAEREALTSRAQELERRATAAEERAGVLQGELTAIVRSWSWRVGRRLVAAAKLFVPGR
jgi:hypothetical protein